MTLMIIILDKLKPNEIHWVSSTVKTQIFLNKLMHRLNFV